MLDFSLKFTKLSKYAPSSVSNLKDEMSHFLTGVSKDLMEKCRSAKLHDIMNISHIMVHTQQVEESRLRRKNIEAKRAKAYEGGSSTGR